MPDNPEITRLVDLLISRQDAQQQQLELLGTNARADQARHEQRMAQLETAAAADKTLHEQRMAKMEADAKATAERLDRNLAKTDEVLLTFGKVQVGILEQMKSMNGQLLELHQGLQISQRRQEAFWHRQDEFNVIFLEEIREIKTDVRALKHDVQYLKEVVLQQHEERLRRLEDFMNGTALRKAS